jgi:hypothetical protein
MLADPPKTNNMSCIIEPVEREMKKRVNASTTQDTTKKYNLCPGKKDLLQQIYVCSQKTVKEWIPPQLELLGTDATFDT